MSLVVDLRIVHERFGSSSDPSLHGHLHTDIVCTSGRLHGEFFRLQDLFLQSHRETDPLFAASGVQQAQHDRGLFHFLRTVFSSQLKPKVGSTLVTRLLISSLSLGVPVPRATQCM